VEGLSVDHSYLEQEYGYVRCQSKSVMIERAVVEAGGVVTVMQQKRFVDAKHVYCMTCLQKHALIALCALTSRVSACSSLSYTCLSPPFPPRLTLIDSHPLPWLCK